MIKCDHSIQEVLELVAKKHPDKEAIFDGYRRVTYRELIQEVEILSCALDNLGIKKEDRIMVVLPNWNEFVTLYFAISRLGAILVPLYHKTPPEKITAYIDTVQPKVVFVGDPDKYNSIFSAYISKKDHFLQHVISVRFTNEEIMSYVNLFENYNNYSVSIRSIDPHEDVFSILYTSGTSGKSKGVMLTHKNVVHTAYATAEVLECTKEDVFLIAVPVYHVFGMVPGILTSIISGAKMVLMDQYKPGEALKLIEQERITVHHGVPTMFILELNHPDFSKSDLSSLRTGIIAAAPCPAEIIRKIKYEMECNIIVSYGLTETSAPICFTNFTDDIFLQSSTVGKKLKGYEVKVVDYMRKEVATNEVGELACRGFGVMKSYFKMPEKTQEVLDENGWFYTGDLATIDENGYIKIIGRKKEMIFREGQVIYPNEVEEVFYKHDSVLEAAVVILPNNYKRKQFCVAIKLKPGYIEDEESMLKYIRTCVDDYKVPDTIIILDDFPKTTRGKINKTYIKSKVY